MLGGEKVGRGGGCRWEMGKDGGCTQPAAAAQDCWAPAPGRVPAPNTGTLYLRVVDRPARASSDSEVSVD